MNEILEYLRESIADEYFSKAEKRSLKEMIARYRPDQHQLNFIQSKIYELANEKIRDDNYRFILEWVRTANSALLITTANSSDAFFSPGEACRSTIIQHINKTITQLNICVFTISDDLITKAILTSCKKGIPIRIITDNDKSWDEGSDIDQLARAGIAVKIDNTPNHMHHKFMVTDNKTLITGSYNWTRSAAQYNHENILITQEGGVVKAYLNEFEQLWKVMKPYTG